MLLFQVGVFFFIIIGRENENKIPQNGTLGETLNYYYCFFFCSVIGYQDNFKQTFNHL